MNDLSDIRKMSKLDVENVLSSTIKHPDQCLQAWSESSKITYPDSYKQIKNVVVCGMGGSGFPPKTVKRLYHDLITVPYEVVQGYTLPRYVDEHTLVILSSYSGSTEEIVHCGREASSRNAKVTAVTSGGKIGELLASNNLSGYIFDPVHNPSKQPRIGGGYLLLGHIGVLVSLGLLEVKKDEVGSAIEHARVIGKKCDPSVIDKDNPAKLLARTLKGTHVSIITAEFLEGFGNGFANQVNETAKQLSDYRYIPELNHHLMEGLTHPESIKSKWLYLFFQSKLYHKRVIKRFDITIDVVEKQKIQTHSVHLSGDTKLAQVLEAYTLSSFTTYYMAMLYDLNPSRIPWVDYFKEKLTGK